MRQLNFVKLFCISVVLCLSLLITLPIYAEESPHFTIGYDIYNGSHPWAVESIKFVNYIADTLDIDLQVAFNNMRDEEQVANIENFISAKVDAILILALNPAILPRIGAMLEKAQIPWASYDTVAPDEVKEILRGYKYYIGHVGQNNKNTGNDVATFFIDNGRKQAVVLTAGHGYTMHEERAAGFKEAFEALGGKVLATQFNLSTAEEATKSMESLMAAYSDIDAVYGTGSPHAIGAVEALRRHGLLEKVLVAETDLGSEVMDLMVKGEVDFSSGGHWADGGLCLIRVFNYLTGKPLGTNKDEALINLYPVRGTEEIELYKKWYIERPPLSREEVKNLTGINNPEMTIEILQNLTSNFGVQETVKRRMEEQEQGKELPPLYSEME